MRSEVQFAMLRVVIDGEDSQKSDDFTMDSTVFSIEFFEITCELAHAHRKMTPAL